MLSLSADTSDIERLRFNLQFWLYMYMRSQRISYEVLTFVQIQL